MAAIKASKLGAKTAVAEEKAPSGTCLNRGCIPTKVYAHAAVLINEIQNVLELRHTASSCGVISGRHSRYERPGPKKAGGYLKSVPSCIYSEPEVA